MSHQSLSPLKLVRKQNLWYWKFHFTSNSLNQNESKHQNIVNLHEFANWPCWLSKPSHYCIELQARYTKIDQICALTSSRLSQGPQPTHMPQKLRKIAKASDALPSCSSFCKSHIHVVLQQVLWRFATKKHAMVRGEVGLLHSAFQGAGIRSNVGHPTRWWPQVVLGKGKMGINK